MRHLVMDCNVPGPDDSLRGRTLIHARATRQVKRQWQKDLLPDPAGRGSNRTRRTSLSSRNGWHSHWRLWCISSAAFISGANIRYTHEPLNSERTLSGYRYSVLWCTEVSNNRAHHPPYRSAKISFLLPQTFLRESLRKLAISDPHCVPTRAL